eukprot:15482798-Alexandrium_andersonii.AAC.1
MAEVALVLPACLLDLDFAGERSGPEPVVAKPGRELVAKGQLAWARNVVADPPVGHRTTGGRPEAYLDALRLANWTSVRRLALEVVNSGGLNHLHLSWADPTFRDPSRPGR